MTKEEKAIIYFKDMRKMLCEDYLNICPKDSVAYKATLAEKDFYDTAIKALEQTGWIPVSERLPEAGEYIGDVTKYYLVQNEYGDMMVARYTHSGYWEQIYQLKPVSEEIVAWMPLPEPYKAESEVQDADND